MKKLNILVCILLGLFSVEAYSQQLAVESFVLAETDMTANLAETMVRDQNGEVCALIKLETTQKGFTFDVGVLGVTSVVEQPAEIWVYVPFGVRKITIQHPQLGMIRDYQIPCSIEKGRTYVMKLAAGTVRTVVEYTASKQFLSIELYPSDAILEIDGKVKAVTGGVYQELLSFGKYKYKVSRLDYHDVVGVIEISDPENPHHLTLRLDPAFGYLSVLEKNQPDLKDAMVYVDGKPAGMVPVNKLQVSSGKHSIKIIKSLYESYDSTFDIADNENKVLNPKLVPDFAEITLKTVPESDIYVNGELKGKHTWTGRLASGSYIFESRQSGHISSKMPYDISNKDQSKVITIPEPTPVYGSLAVLSTPSKAKIYIDGKYVGDTPKFISRQVIGEHEIKIELSGYVAQTKKVSVVEGKEVSVSFTMEDFMTLSEYESANSYIVSQSGTYRFATVKGNSNESVGNVASAEVLWESFGTNVTPKSGDLISKVTYSGGYITFLTSAKFKEGNAVIAAKDAAGNILWSWHIWMTDKPAEHVYIEDDLVLMDRNLGATSASSGSVGSLGLLYQWGRKDPFVASSSTDKNTKAKSTVTWSKGSGRESVDYAVSHPTAFINNASTDSRYKYDWERTSDMNRWHKDKTIYDPCPPGWSVPEGDLAEVLAAYGKNVKYSNDKRGVNIKDFNGNDVWYPASGSIHYEYSTLSYCGDYGFYWTSTPTPKNVYVIRISNYDIFKDGAGLWEYGGSRANAFSVRCMKNVSLDPSNAADLSADATANSYIVSEKGLYKFAATKGNTRLSVGKINSVEVLWESFGTDEEPEEGDLIKNVKYSDPYIVFKTSGEYKEGNAVIAAKDAQGEILWSWHIWFTDQPQEHVYSNGAGTMMDRNLGAVSSDKNDPGSLGLLYQWGRKDPFLGSSTIDTWTTAEANRLLYHDDARSNPVIGTIEYSIANPTEFITENSSNNDWYYHYTYSNATDNTRWQSVKTMYDPCPAGWRVPDGGDNGIWTDISFSDYASYPNSGFISGRIGSESMEYDTYYWSCTPYSLESFKEDACVFSRRDRKNDHVRRSHGNAVRCMKETNQNPYSVMSDLDDAEAEDLSAAGSANCYIVSKPGLYKLKTVKGNSDESVGNVTYCAVLWESYGTNTLPKRGIFVDSVDLKNGYVLFRTPQDFKEGNAVIAAISKKNEILWSWHLWFTDQPQEQVYNNNAGVVMDRNLGALSAEPGDEEVNGLLYQWGRKDPFCDKVATVPTLYFKELKSSYDSNEFKWDSKKSVYDPCPAGWRVPDGGNDGLWATAYPNKTEFTNKYDKDNRGTNLTKKFGIDKVIWYPESKYWTCTYSSYLAYSMSITGKDINTVKTTERDYECSVRCVKE